MPSTQLWAVNTLGNVFTLTVKENCWRKLPYQGLEFKRVSALPQCVWAVGGDHQIYLFVPSGDVPIRCREVTFENERWNPVEGFSSKLLPSDRPHWSSEDGLHQLPKTEFQLPTSSWEWEDEWYIEQNLNGQPLGSEGWMYAVDFPFAYSAEKNWKSMVRRRKWVRHRRYAATNKWSQIPSIYDDPVTEPFIDISVGGYEIPGENDKLTVWAVTILGRVVFRHGIVRTCPEGEGWTHVPTKSSSGVAEIHQISVGPTGLVWAVTWQGDILVRTGVTRDHVMGTDWALVKPPDESHRIFQVSVGSDVAWAISRDKKVWFRTGIKGVDAGTCKASAVGNAWVEMVGEMNLITVGPGNQVWGLDQDGTTVWYRTDVSYAELSGRTWKPIILPISHSPKRSSSASSLASSSGASQQRDSDTDSYHEYTVHPSPPLHRFSSLEDSSYIPKSGFKSIDLPKIPTHRPSTSQEMQDMLNSFSKITTFNRLCSENNDFESIYDEPDVDPRESSMKKDSDQHDKLRVTFANCEPSAMDMGDIDAGIEDIVESLNNSGDPTSLTKHAKGDNADDDWDEDSQSEDHGYADERCEDVAAWTWISGSACTVDAQNVSHWFRNVPMSNNYVINEKWRMTVLTRLRARYDRSVRNFSTYPDAIEKSTWIKTGNCRFLESSRYQHWIACHLSLERFGAEDAPDGGTLILSYLVGQNKMLRFNLSDITCILNASDKEKLIMAIHTPSLILSRKPVKLNFANDTDLEDWLSTLNVTCSTLRGIRGTPNPTAIWSTTIQGDIYVCQPVSNVESTPSNLMFWRLLGGGHLLMVETCPVGVVWGLGYNNVPWVYTGGYGGGPFKGISGCNVQINSMSDIRCIYIYENQRWNPLTSFSSKGLPTDRYMWSDKSGRYYCTKENTKLPSHHWHWISDWAIDYKTPGGVDKEGWQYASDFPRTYYPYKAFTHYVRRRRWYRKCQLNTTGPWKELVSTPLLDISIQIDLPQSSRENIAVWAIAVNGDALCRLGVTAACPEGTSWFPVPADQPFKSISIGGSYRVWTVAKNGSAFLRNGVSPTCPTGQVWFHIESPQNGSVLKQISVGKTSVFAVDTGNRLWYRRDIMPLFPEGTCWVLVSENIKQVSVGPEDQVWAICDTMQTSSGALHGVVCRRTGIAPNNKMGTGWEYGIGGGWQYISIRGCSQDAEESCLNR